ncbi:hypothetical protein IJ531_02915 [bacterium]|nr:hypothetical protein [bacterium]
MENTNTFKPVKQEKSVISIRINCNILEAVDNYSAAINLSRNEFIVQCIEYALNNLDK